MISNTFYASTIEDVIISHQRNHNGTTSWKNIKANVEGAIYNRKLKRQVNGIIKNALFDPTKNFSFENISNYTVNRMKFMLQH